VSPGFFENAGEGGKIELGTAYQNLALVYAQQGRPKQALQAVNLALAAWNRALPPDHPFIVYGLSTKIVIYQKLRAFREAEQVIPEALRLGPARFGPDHPERMILLTNSAGV